MTPQRSFIVINVSLTGVWCRTFPSAKNSGEKEKRKSHLAREASCLCSICHNGTWHEQFDGWLRGDNTEIASASETSVRHRPCTQWHLRFHVVHIFTGFFSPGPWFWSHFGWRCAAHRSTSRCPGYSICWFSVWQKWRFLVVQIRQKEDLALVRYYSLSFFFIVFIMVSLAVTSFNQ